MVGTHHVFLPVLANKETYLFVLLRVKMLILFCYDGARSGVVRRLCSDDLVIALVDMHNLSSFGCHRRGRDQSSNNRNERQRHPIRRARNLYAQIS